jgi:hypothetical protein
MALIRHPRKLVRPGHWVLAKVPDSLTEHTYDFQGMDAVYVCIVPLREPRRESESGFEWRYRVYWRFPRELDEGEEPYWTHSAQYRIRDTTDESKYRNGTYTYAIYWDFDLIQVYHDHRVFYDEDESKKWWSGEGGHLYIPGSDDPDECPGPDYSLYQCSNCEKWVQPHSDDDGNLVCPECGPLYGLVHGVKTAEQIERARALASFVGPKCRDELERRLNFLAHREGWGYPSQTLLYGEDQFSFYFVMQSFVDGQWKRGMNGGLIMHGPHVEEVNSSALPKGQHVEVAPDGGYAFTTWDYQEKRSRPATEAEIRSICWSTHT